MRRLLPICFVWLVFCSSMSARAGDDIKALRFGKLVEREGQSLD